jgi:hypothetical protein
MLVCFGAAWPASIYKSWKSGATAGKSVIFLIIVEVGYIAGVIHKLIYSMDAVILLYALNAAMVLVDIGLYFRNSARERWVAAADITSESSANGPRKAAL